jgi:hypothetical protein
MAALSNLSSSVSKANATNATSTSIRHGRGRVVLEVLFTAVLLLVNVNPSSGFSPAFNSNNINSNSNINSNININDNSNTRPSKIVGTDLEPTNQMSWHLAAFNSNSKPMTDTDTDTDNPSSKPFSKKVDMNIKNTDKQYFLASLDNLDALNPATPQRTALLDTMIAQKVLTSKSASASDLKQYDHDNGHDRDREQEDSSNRNRNASTPSPSPSLENPGSASTFSKVASGTWKVIYAPHMTTFSSLLNGSFDVSYTLSNTNSNGNSNSNSNSNEKMGTEDGNTSTYGTITSHAKYQFPIVGTGYLSVSGTYGSVNDQVSRVEFKKAWIKPLASGFDTSTSRKDNDNDDETDKTGPYPYSSLEEVPDGGGQCNHASVIQSCNHALSNHA